MRWTSSTVLTGHAIKLNLKLEALEGRREVHLIHWLLFDTRELGGKEKDGNGQQEGKMPHPRNPIHQAPTQLPSNASDTYSLILRKPVC